MAAGEEEEEAACPTRRAGERSFSEKNPKILENSEKNACG